MKANDLPIINFLQAPNIQFVIPVYQRNYDWTNNECKELLNDIIAVETTYRDPDISYLNINNGAMALNT